MSKSQNNNKIKPQIFQIWGFTAEDHQDFESYSFGREGDPKIFLFIPIVRKNA